MRQKIERRAGPMTDEQKAGITTHPILHETPVHDVAREFIAYYKRGGGCSNCGGLPHSSTCFVGRMEDAFSAESAPSSDLAALLQFCRALIDRMNAYADGSDDGFAISVWADELEQRADELDALLLGKRGAQTEEK